MKIKDLSKVTLGQCRVCQRYLVLDVLDSFTFGSKDSVTTQQVPVCGDCQKTIAQNSKALGWKADA